MFSFELLAYRELVNPRAMPGSTKPGEKLPDYFVAADDISPREHVDIQAAAQKWVDSSISKTANVPTDYPYEDFKDIYLYAHEQGLKGCTTFRFNPEAFQGVLVKEEGPQEHDLSFHARGRQRGRGERRRRDRVRRRDAHRRESVRRAEGRLLRQVLKARTERAKEADMAKITIDKKIVKYAVAKDEAEKKPEPAQPEREEQKVIQMHEKLERPEVLIGSTYKIKTPVSDHAMYVTINDIVLERGHGARAAPAVRDLHQLEEPGSLPVDRRAHADHVRGVS